MATLFNARDAVQKSRITPIAFASLFFSLSSPGATFAQSAQDVCPKGYSVFETVCLNDVTGDVVNQSRGNGAAGATSPAPNPSNTPAPAKSGG